jgi:hypothetical protein
VIATNFEAINICRRARESIAESIEEKNVEVVETTACPTFGNEKQQQHFANVSDDPGMCVLLLSLANTFQMIYIIV